MSSTIDPSNNHVRSAAPIIDEEDSVESVLGSQCGHKIGIRQKLKGTTKKSIPSTSSTIAQYLVQNPQPLSDV